MRLILAPLFAISLYGQTAVPTIQAGSGDVFSTTPARLGTARGAHSVTLDGSGSTCSGGCLYAWRQTAGAPVTISGSTTATPTIYGVFAGQYTVQLIVKAISGGAVSAPVALTFGGVPADSKGVTAPSPNTLIAQMIGGQTRLGAGPWPTFDFRQAWISDFFGGLYATEWPAFWLTDTPLTGTVTIDSNTDVNIVGTGTAFTTDFACDPSNPDENSYQFIIVIYQDASQGNRTRYHAKQISSCADAAHLVWEYTETMPVGTFQYIRATPAQALIWRNKLGGNINYYDNVLAHYFTYYRSNLTQFRTYAQTLAYAWATDPWFNMGQADGDGVNSSPRYLAFLGLMIYAEDGHPEVWEWMNFRLDYLLAQSVRVDNLPQRDTREAAYMLWPLALAAAHHPDPVRRAAYLTGVQKSLDDRWAPARESYGVWWNWYTDSIDITGPVTVTNGSTAVTSSGLFLPSHCSGPSTSLVMIWFTVPTDPPLANFLGDPDAYRCTYNNANSITLTSSYIGTSGTAKYFQARQFDTIGIGWQPFMQGIAAQAFHHAYIATGDPRLPGWISTVSANLNTYGYYAAIKALYYGVEYPGCPFNALIIGTGQVGTGRWMCTNTSDGDGGQRFYRAEVGSGQQYAALLDPIGTPQSEVDEVIGVNFGEGGGPQTEDHWTNENTDPAIVAAQKNAKFFGFAWGVGSLSQITGARLGGYAGANLVTRGISFGSPGATTSLEVRTGPMTSSTITACPTSPCNVSLDTTTGGVYRVLRGGAVGGWINF